MALINCPECGKEISEGSKFCIHCGYPLDEDNNTILTVNDNEYDLLICPECGHDVSETADICPNCGFSIRKYIYGSNVPKIVKIVSILITIAIICAIYFFSTRCEHTGGCYNKKLPNSNFCSYHQAQIDTLISYGSYSNNSSYSSSSTVNSSTIFKNLKISNFSSSSGKHSGTMTCEVTNNNKYTVYGYFYVNYYDAKGKLLYSQLMSLDDVARGETVTCSALIPKDKYPSGYDHVRFSQATLLKR